MGKDPRALEVVAGTPWASSNKNRVVRRAIAKSVQTLNGNINRTWQKYHSKNRRRAKNKVARKSRKKNRT